MSDAFIQMQLYGGTWRTYTTTINDSQYILKAMTSLQRQHPDKRIRAIDRDGRVLDIL